MPPAYAGQHIEVLKTGTQTDGDSYLSACLWRQHDEVGLLAIIYLLGLISKTVEFSLLVV